MTSTRNLIIYWICITSVILLTMLASSAGAHTLGEQFGLMLGTLIGLAVWIAFVTIPITGVAWLVSYVRKEQGYVIPVFHLSCAGAVCIIALAQFAGLSR